MTVVERVKRDPDGQGRAVSRGYAWVGRADLAARGDTFPEHAFRPTSGTSLVFALQAVVATSYTSEIRVLRPPG